MLTGPARRSILSSVSLGFVCGILVALWLHYEGEALARIFHEPEVVCA